MREIHLQVDNYTSTLWVSGILLCLYFALLIHVTFVAFRAMTILHS